MKMHALRAAGALALLVPAAIGLAGSAGADEPTFVMPSVEKMSLQKAANTIYKLDPGTKFVIKSHNVDGYKQKQTDWMYWEVCSQSPAAGAEFTASEDIEMSVSRFFDGCDG
jgi:beta-lactam-binding protein with PASTA domain